MRIKGIDPNHPPESLRPLFQRSQERYGRVITPTLVMAHRPEILLAASGLGRAIDGSPVIQPRLKTLAALRAAQMIGCPF
jgi:alkylhydroperoxidase family enzyme